jgi:competence protein ComGF
MYTRLQTNLMQMSGDKGTSTYKKLDSLIQKRKNYKGGETMLGNVKFVFVL